MNLDRVVFWIRLIAWGILDVLNGLDDEPGDGDETGGDVYPWFKPERIQIWISILARAALTAIEGVVPPERSGVQSSSSALWPSFKPERIQFWLTVFARFVLAVIDGLNDDVSEETGKSGERSAAPASEEAGNQE